MLLHNKGILVKDSKARRGVRIISIRLVVWLLSVSVALVTIESSGLSINVANPSFEDYNIGIDGGFVDASITDWIEVPFAGFYNGLADPQDASWPGTTGSPGTIPGGSGDQIAFVQNTGYIYQDISAVLNPGYNLLIPGTLTLRVAVGDRIDYAIGPYYIDLFAGATSIASASGSSESLPDGVFTDIVLTYTATVSDPNLGQQLRIRLGSDPALTDVPSQVAYDYVRLEWEIPEPSVAMLGVVSLLALTRRKC
jgi:hypothetical protein